MLTVPKVSHLRPEHGGFGARRASNAHTHELRGLRYCYDGKNLRIRRFIFGGSERSAPKSIREPRRRHRPLADVKLPAVQIHRDYIRDLGPRLAFVRMQHDRLAAAMSDRV